MAGAYVAILAAWVFLWTRSREWWDRMRPYETFTHLGWPFITGGLLFPIPVLVAIGLEWLLPGAKAVAQAVAAGLLLVDLLLMLSLIFDRPRFLVPPGAR
jgi:hypothetical protein